MTRRISGIVAAAAVQLVALVLAHELVFLARYGSRYGEALVHAGHGETWTAAVTTSLLIGAALAVVAGFRLGHLGLLVRRAGAAPPGDRAHGIVGDLAPRSLFSAWLRVGPRLAILNVALLSVQENLERVAIGGAVPGPAILITPEYAGGVWITLAVGLAVGLVAALFDWRRRVLSARIQAPRQRLPRVVAVPAKRAGTLVTKPRESIIGRRSALRAPPRAIAV